MKTKIFKYQIIAFGNYSDVIPNTENIKFFFDNFLEKQIIPNQFQELNLNLRNPDFKQDIVNRLGLTSLDKKWEIRFDIDKLEILFSEDLKEVPKFEVDVFIEKSLEFFRIINSKFPRKHSRLGLVVQYLISDIDSKKVFTKLNTTLDYFKDENPIEWNNQVVVRKVFDIPNKEIFNVSNNLKWIKANLISDNVDIPFEGIHVIIDINTLQENTNNRFDIDNVNSFLSKSEEIRKIIDEQNLAIFEN